MRSDDETIIRWLEDPEFQRKARAIAHYFVRRYQLTTATADDLYQSVMVKLLRYSQDKELREIKRPLAFFYAVAHNEARDIFSMSAENKARRVFSKDHGHLNVSLEDMPDAIFSDHLETVRRIESRVLLSQVLGRLDEEERHLFYLLIVEGYSTREIARLMEKSNVKISHVTVAFRLQLIKKKIRETIFGLENPRRAPER